MNNVVFGLDAFEQSLYKDLFVHEDKQMLVKQVTKEVCLTSHWAELYVHVHDVHISQNIFIDIYIYI